MGPFKVFEIEFFWTTPLIPHESLWTSVIRWKPVFSSNWKNIKNRRGEGGGEPNIVEREGSV
jgi:hypothetical protein